MKIYLSHSANFDYLNELYWPLRETIAQTHDIYFPHSEKNAATKTDNIVAKSDVVLAEVSRPSTGQGIELGWADRAGVPIACFYREGSKLSGSLKFVSDTFISYQTMEEMTDKLSEWLDKQPASQG
jgi:hypothetical protein